MAIVLDIDDWRKTKEAFVDEKKGGKKKWLFLGIGAIVIIIIIAAVASGGGNKKENLEGKKTETKESVNTVGVPVEVGDLTVTVDGWSPSPGDGFSTPAEGNQYIVVDLNITNNGDKTEAISTMLQMSIRTDDGKEYDQALYFPEPKYPDGDILAGQNAKGNVAFEVPGTIGGMSFRFEPMFGDAVDIRLQ